MSGNVVNLTGRRDGAATTPVADNPSSRPADPRAQLRVPLRDLDEMEAHLILLLASVTASLAEIKRARRAGRHDEAKLLIRDHLSRTNRLMNVKRYGGGYT